MKKNEIDIGLAELMPRSQSLFRSVDQPQVDYLRAGFFELFGDLPLVSFQTIFQAGELRPIRVQTNAEEPNLQLDV